jgi:hypothetical protein
MLHILLRSTPADLAHGDDLAKENGMVLPWLIALDGSVQVDWRRIHWDCVWRLRDKRFRRERQNVAIAEDSVAQTREVLISFAGGH